MGNSDACGFCAWTCATRYGVAGSRSQPGLGPGPFRVSRRPARPIELGGGAGVAGTGLRARRGAAAGRARRGRRSARPTSLAPVADAGRGAGPDPLLNEGCGCVRVRLAEGHPPGGLQLEERVGLRRPVVADRPAAPVDALVRPPEAHDERRRADALEMAEDVRRVEVVRLGVGEHHQHALAGGRREVMAHRHLVQRVERRHPAVDAERRRRPLDPDGLVEHEVIGAVVGGGEQVRKEAVRQRADAGRHRRQLVVQPAGERDRTLVARLGVRRRTRRASSASCRGRR